MSEKNAEDVKHVVAIIGQCERVNDGVVADYRQHDRDCDTDDRLPWVTGRIREWPYTFGEALTIKKWPGEERKVRPDVDHLCKMD